MNNEELNKAAERYARESYPLRDYAPDLERKEVHEEQRKCGVAFKAGAEWMRKQMMKDAVEGVVVIDKDDFVGFYKSKDSVHRGRTEWVMNEEDSYYGTLPATLFPELTFESEPKKIKLIIIKED